MKKLILFLALFSAATISAQWNTDLSQNSVAVKENGGNSFSATTNDGRTYIAFWKQVAAPKNYELRIQLIGTDGTKLFGPNGLLVSDQIPMGTYTVFEDIKVDSQNNVYLGVTGTASGTPGFVFKISPDGNLVYGSNGIALGEGYLPTLLPMSNGDLLVSYWPASQKQARIQRYNSSGQPIWSQPTVVFADDVAKSTVPADLYELSNGDFVFVYNKILSGISTNLFARRFGGDGTAKWAAPLLLSTQTSAYNVKNSSFIENDVVYYGFTSGMGGRSDSYLIRINPDGTLPWGVGGVDFDIKKTNFEKSVKIASTPGKNHIWAICNYTAATSQNIGGEYVQKFNKTTGERIFGDDAKELFPMSFENFTRHSSDLQIVNDFPIFMLVNKPSSGSEYITLSAVMLKEDGTFAFPETSLPITTYLGFKHHLQFLKPVNGQIVTVFNENRNEASDSTYIQNFIIPKGYLASSETAVNEISIYPNPVADVLFIRNIKENELVTIFNISGQLVKKEPVKDGKINVSKLPKGVYIVNFSQDGKKTTKKLIKN